MIRDSQCTTLSANCSSSVPGTFIPNLTFGSPAVRNDYSRRHIIHAWEHDLAGSGEASESLDLPAPRADYLARYRDSQVRSKALPPRSRRRSGPARLKVRIFEIEPLITQSGSLKKKPADLRRRVPLFAQRNAIRPERPRRTRWPCRLRRRPNRRAERRCPTNRRTACSRSGRSRHGRWPCRF